MKKIERERTCFLCKKRFTKNKKGPQFTEDECQPCRNKRQVRNSYLLKTYGISLEEYTKMFHEQSGVCAICKNPEEIGLDSLCVDHHHGSGRIRGLLCRRCNSGIGYFRDDTKILLQAISYLREK